MKKYILLFLFLFSPSVVFATAYSSIGSGNWSNAAIWNPAVVPDNNATITIAAGHTITFNVDQSNTHANGVTITIATGTPGGSLVASTVYGTFLSLSDPTVTINETTGWIEGQRFVYHKGAGANLDPLVDGTTYFIDNPSGATFKIAASYVDCGTDTDIALSNGNATNTFEPIYSIKCAGLITVNAGGSLLAGTSLITPYPDACTFTIDLNKGAGYITGAGTIALYCSEPAYNYCLLSSAYTAADDDHIHVTFPTANQTRWDVGDTVRIDTLIYAATSSQTGVISAIADNLITMAVSKPANNKVTGSYCFLVTRNVRIIDDLTPGYAFYSSSNLTLSAEISGVLYPICDATNLVVNGGIISGGQSVFPNFKSITINGGIVSGWSGNLIQSGIGTFTINGGIISGGSIVLLYGGSYSTTITINGGTITSCDTAINQSAMTAGLQTLNITGGSITNCTTGLLSIVNPVITSGSITNCTTGLSTCTNVLMSNNTLTNTTDVSNCINLTASNTFFGGSTEVAALSTSYPLNYIASYTHDQDTTKLSTWTLGGSSTKQYVVYPTGYNWSHKLALSSASYWGFYQEKVVIQPQQTLRYVVYMEKDAAMTVKPKVEILSETADTIAYSAAVPLSLATYPDDDVNDWQTLSVSYQNTTSIPMPVYLRVSGKNATGNVYFTVVPVQGKESW